MTNRDEKSVGSMRCSCGETKDVRQSKKRGHHLYTVCPSCGLDQRTGAPVQSKIWNTADFDRDVLKPSNVIDDWSGSSEKEGEKVQDKTANIDEISLDLTEQDIVAQATETEGVEQEPERKSGVLRLVGCLMMLLSFVGVAWTQV